MSNTKLSKEAKRAWKDDWNTLREDGALVFAFPDLRVVVLFVPEFAGSKMVNVAVSVCSEDEQKFRKWTGISRAMGRFYNREVIKIVRPAYPGMTAEALAEIACGEY